MHTHRHTLHTDCTHAHMRTGSHTCTDTPLFAWGEETSSCDSLTSFLLLISSAGMHLISRPLSNSATQQVLKQTQSAATDMIVPSNAIVDAHPSSLEDTVDVLTVANVPASQTAVQTSWGSLFYVEVAPCDTLATFKLAVYRETGIPTEDQVPWSLLCRRDGPLLYTALVL
jgi:hypothetical protein